MAKLDEKTRKALQDDIHLHLRMEGPSEWGRLQAKYPEVSRATFFRIVGEVREQITAKAATDSPEAVRVAQARIKSMPESLPAIQSETAKHLPAMPSPSIIASKRDRGAAALRVLATFDNVMSDGEMLRTHSVTRTEDGTEKIKNPMMFQQAAKLRLEVARSYLDALAQAYDMEQMQTFVAIVMEEIGKAAPEIQHTILLRLKAANAMHGMTVHADL